MLRTISKVPSAHEKFKDWVRPADPRDLNPGRIGKYLAKSPESLPAPWEWDAFVTSTCPATQKKWRSKFYGPGEQTPIFFTCPKHPWCLSMHKTLMCWAIKLLMTISHWLALKKGNCAMFLSTYLSFFHYVHLSHKKKKRQWQWHLFQVWWFANPEKNVKFRRIKTGHEFKLWTLANKSLEVQYNILFWGISDIFHMNTEKLFDEHLVTLINIHPYVCSQ